MFMWSCVTEYDTLWRFKTTIELNVSICIHVCGMTTQRSTGLDIICKLLWHAISFPSSIPLKDYLILADICIPQPHPRGPASTTFKFGADISFPTWLDRFAESQNRVSIHCRNTNREFIGVMNGKVYWVAKM